MYRILIADDEGIMVESLKTIITSSFGDECEIACAKTGRAVVEQAESFRPDIALVDIRSACDRVWLYIQSSAS